MARRINPSSQPWNFFAVPSVVRPWNSNFNSLLSMILSSDFLSPFTRNRKNLMFRNRRDHPRRPDLLPSSHPQSVPIVILLQML
jgi:hypothetical protein